MTKCCPTCGRPYPPALTVRGPVRQRLVDIIAAHPDGLSSWELLDKVYADDPAGGPDHPNIINVHVWNVNRQLREQGYEIRPTWLGPGARYRLVKARV